jgi:hypothetical protein
MFAKAVLAILLAVPARAADPELGVFVFGGARFTVAAPECVRIEYSTSGAFTDAPSAFARRREARYLGYSVDLSTGRLVLDTGRLRLSYAPDGWPPSVASLKVDIRRGSETVTWTPERERAPLLEGGAGVLTAAGWSLVDDSAGRGTDWYLFAYGLDYKAGLRALAALQAVPALPSEPALAREFGAWPRRLRAALSPYLLSSAWQSHEEGLPLRRPLFLEHPLRDEAYRNPKESFIGDSLLELPRGEPGWLPDGDWFDLSTGEKLSGPAELPAAKGAGRHRILAKGGAPIAMRPSAGPRQALALRAYPGPDGVTVWTLLREKGAPSAELSCLRQGGRTRIKVEPAAGEGPPSRGCCIVELGGPPAERAVLDGKDLPVTYSPRDKLSRVQVPRGGGDGFSLYVWQP